MKITKQTKTILIVTGILGFGGAIAAILINRGNKSKVLSQVNEILGHAEGSNSVTQAATDLSKMSSKPSYPDSQYALWANALFACFDGYGTCNTYIDIYKKLQNDADFLKLVTAFGTKRISSGKFNPEPDFTGTLAGVMNNELSTSELQAVNQALKDNGISYSF